MDGHTYMTKLSGQGVGGGLNGWWGFRSDLRRPLAFIAPRPIPTPTHSSHQATITQRRPAHTRDAEQDQKCLDIYKQ